MKVCIEPDERWPDYSVQTESLEMCGGDNAEISPRMYQRWLKACTEYNIVQHKLQIALDKREQKEKSERIARIKKMVKVEDSK